MNKALVTTGDVARALGVTINTVKAWIQRGQVQAVRLPSGHYRIPREELERLRADVDSPSLGEIGRFRGNAVPGSSYRQRREQWQVADAWIASQPVEAMPIEKALEWVSVLLREARSHGPLVAKSLDDKVDGQRLMRRALAHAHR